MQKTSANAQLYQTNTQKANLLIFFVKFTLRIGTQSPSVESVDLCQVVVENSSPSEQLHLVNRLEIELLEEAMRLVALDAADGPDATPADGRKVPEESTEQKLGDVVRVGAQVANDSRPVNPITDEPVARNLVVLSNRDPEECVLLLQDAFHDRRPCGTQ